MINLKIYQICHNLILPPVLNIRSRWLFFEMLRLQNMLLNYDIFDIFLDYSLVYMLNKGKTYIMFLSPGSQVLSI